LSTRNREIDSTVLVRLVTWRVCVAKKLLINNIIIAQFPKRLLRLFDYFLIILIVTSEQKLLKSTVNSFNIF